MAENNLILAALANNIVNLSTIQKNILLSSSSDDDSEMEASTNMNQPRIRISDYVLNIVDNYLEDDFKSHFRMSRTTCEILTNCIGVHYNKIRGRAQVPCKHAVMVTLWYLGNIESYRQVGDRFNLERGHTYRICIRICKIIFEIRNRYIKWPNSTEALRTTINQFDIIRGGRSFPNVVGCVDGTHIRITGPKMENSYYNRHGYHSIQLQGICNAEMLFTDIYVGWPGSVHDARVWRNSPIFNILNENGMDSQMHILGDTAYPVSLYLQCPYRDNGHLTVQQRNYNKILSSTRVLIEQAYARLKGIFRRLKLLEITNMENAKYYIMASCVLHNLIILEKDDVNFEFEEVTANTEINNDDHVDFEAEHRAGFLKRDLIAEQLF